MKTIYVLGAPDPEMREIEAVINSRLDDELDFGNGNGGGIIYAAKDGIRVTPSTAYKANGFVRSDGVPTDMPDDCDQLITVECAVEGFEPDVHIDHHRPGDRGYGQPPERFWEASSLGQICNHYAIKPSGEQLIAAAADQCLSHAYQGKCPGIDPKELKAWRVQSRSANQGVDPKVIEGKIDAAIATIQTLPKIKINGVVVANSVATGSFPEAPEAVAITGIPLMYSLPDQATERTKVGLLGADAETIRAWMATIGDLMAVEDIYGDPERGYAGAYLK